MRLPYELTIGWRYTRAGRAGRRNGFISFISGVSMLGISLGVAALIIVLSVMNGFQKEVRDRMLSVIAHIEVFDASRGALPDWRATAAQAQQREDVDQHRHRDHHADPRYGHAILSAAQYVDRVVHQSVRAKPVFSGRSRLNIAAKLIFSQLAGPDVLVCVRIIQIVHFINVIAARSPELENHRHPCPHRSRLDVAGH